MSSKVVWWGQNDFSNERYYSQTNGVIEADDEIVSNVVAIAAGTAQGLLLRKDGTVLGCGLNLYGGSEVPAGLNNVVSSAEEGGSYWAIRGDGTVVQWGHEASDFGTAGIVARLRDVVSIAGAGVRSYMALRKDGTVLGFRVDDADAPVSQVTVHGEVLDKVAALAGMAFTSLVLKTDGTVLSLGESYRPPYEYSSLEPVIIAGQVLSNVVSLASTGSRALALKRDGTVVAWGNNDFGAATVPAGLRNVTALAAAHSQSMALKKDGAVVAWGDSSFGKTSVPAGLSNVIAIATAGDFNLALTAGNIPASVYILPHGRLEEMERAASLVFKGRVLSDSAITNDSAFPYWGKPHGTTLEVISLLKGSVAAKQVELLHLTHGPDAWGGGSPPPDFVLNVGESYLIFATNADKPDWLYSPSASDPARPDRFRQLMKGEPPMRTKDNRPLQVSSAKEVHWRELNLLLNDPAPTNKLYAIEKLDALSFAGRQDDRWRRSRDFKRQDVLRALLPCITNGEERVASRAIGCFITQSNAPAGLEPFAGALTKVANENPSASLRLAAIGGLSGTHFEAISNSLAQLLQHSDETTRSKAVPLVGLCPGWFPEWALRESAGDPSPKVRAAAADVIGSGRMTNLLPVLAKLFGDPVGRERPVGPLTREELEGGGRIVGTEGGTTMVDDPSVPGANVSDVHTSAGYALLRFEPGQVEEILKTNLHDAGFRLQFLLKLGETDPKPWIADMAEIMEARRERNVRKAKADGAPPQTYMYLSGAYNQCWKVIYGYLEKLPASDFAEGRNDRYLKVLEEAGNTGSQEPVQLYELFRLKGLTEHARQFRSRNGNYSGSSLEEFFKRVDSKYGTN
jgi:hypothetical protein